MRWLNLNSQKPMFLLLHLHIMYWNMCNQYHILLLVYFPQSSQCPPPCISKAAYLNNIHTAPLSRFNNTRTIFHIVCLSKCLAFSIFISQTENKFKSVNKYLIDIEENSKNIQKFIPVTKYPNIPKTPYLIIWTFLKHASTHVVGIYFWFEVIC